jgi:hypothetical protein
VVAPLNLFDHGEECLHALFGVFGLAWPGESDEGVEEGLPRLTETAGTVPEQRPGHGSGAAALVQVDALFGRPLLDQQVDDLADSHVRLERHDYVDTAGESASRRQDLRKSLCRTAAANVPELELLGLDRSRTVA